MKSMKTNILNLIPKKYLPDTGVSGMVVQKVATLYINIMKPELLKEWRGLNHGITTHLLCPAKYIEQFKRDPEGYMGHLTVHVWILTTECRTRQDLK